MPRQNPPRSEADSHAASELFRIQVGIPGHVINLDSMSSGTPSDGSRAQSTDHASEAFSQSSRTVSQRVVLRRKSETQRPPHGFLGRLRSAQPPCWPLEVVFTSADSRRMGAAVGGPTSAPEQCCHLTSVNGTSACSTLSLPCSGIGKGAASIGIVWRQGDHRVAPLQCGAD